jgi:hypothetical protein
MAKANRIKTLSRNLKMIAGIQGNISHVIDAISSVRGRRASLSRIILKHLSGTSQDVRDKKPRKSVLNLINISFAYGTRCTYI